MSTITINRQRTGTADRPVYTGRARGAAAAVIVTGAALQVAEFVFENPSDDNATRVAHWVDHPTATAASMCCGLAAVPFLLAGFLILLRITRLRSPRLSIVAGGFLISAMVGLGAVHGAEMIAFSTATAGHPATAVAMLDGSHVVAPMVLLLVMFLGGAVLGTLTLAVAMWRSPLLPRIAAVGVIAFAVLDFAVGSPLVSHLVALANASVVAWAIVTGHSRGSRAAAQ
jgi:hypothetical protein